MRYLFTQANTQIKAQLAMANNTQADKQKYFNLATDMNASLPNLNYIIGCTHVFEGITFAESNVCNGGMSDLWYLIYFYIWLFLSVFFFAVAINKLKPLIEKKKLEIEVIYIFKFSL